jgi:hypothetical protein
MSSQAEDLVATKWFVDGERGDDSNTGFNVGQPIRTLTQLSSRWGQGNTLSPRNGAIKWFFGHTWVARALIRIIPDRRWLRWLFPRVTVNISNTSITDVPDFDIILSDRTQLIFRASKKESRS